MADHIPDCFGAGGLDKIKRALPIRLGCRKKKRSRRGRLLGRKYHTTPLIDPKDRSPPPVAPIKKVSPFRILWILWRIPRLIWSGIYFRFSKTMTAQEMALEARHFLEHLGGMWIKLGQILSMRSDVFSLEFCNELAILQDQARAFPVQRSLKIVEENLQRPISEIFDRFEETPFAAASLSQVHKARLRREKTWVVVKVQRPYAMDYFKYDLWWLSRMADMMSMFDVLPHMKWQDMLSELRHMMDEELDYRREASEMELFRDTLRGHNVYVPKVYIKYTTKRVIVMEFLNGVFMSDYIKMRRTDPKKVAAWRAENNIKPKKLATVLFHSLLRQIYEDRLYHGDLHPGNIVLLRKNKLAFIDFGNTGRFDRDFAQQYALYSEALATGSLSRAADIYLLILGKLPVLDVHRVKLELMGVMERQQARSRIKNLPFHERSMAANSADLNTLIARLRLEQNWNLLKIARTFAAIDMNIGDLNPDIDYMKETGAYHVEAQLRKAKYPDPIAIVRNFTDLSPLIMPHLLRRLLVFDGRTQFAARFLAFLLRSLSRVAWIGILVMIWAFLYQHHNHLVDDFHTQGSMMTNFMESVPALSRIAWILFVIFLIVSNLRFGRFIREMTKKPHRLPGDVS